MRFEEAAPFQVDKDLLYVSTRPTTGLDTLIEHEIDDTEQVIFILISGDHNGKIPGSVRWSDDSGLQHLLYLLPDIPVVARGHEAMFYIYGLLLRQLELLLDHKVGRL